MNKLARHSLLISAVVLLLELAGPVSAQAQQFMPNKYTDPMTNEVLEYNIVLPPGYNAAAATLYPLVICLHAANNTNPPNRTLSADGKCYAGSFTVASSPSFFMVPISQTNASGWGDAGMMSPISQPEKFEGRLTVVVVKEMMAKYKIDPDRLYITGPSMGARGTWDIIRRNPTMFAAAIPAAGPADPVDAPLYASQNLWAINGTNDSTSAENTAAIDAIRKIGGNPIYTLLQGRGHDTWRSLYKDPQLIAWTFAQRRGVPWWSHPPAAPTMIQADPVNGSVALAGGVSVVPPPGLTATTPFPNAMGVTGVGGSSGAAGSSGQAGRGGTGMGSGGVQGSTSTGGTAVSSSTGGAAAVPSSTGGASIPPPPAGSGGNSDPVVVTQGTGGAAATPSSSGGASATGNPPGGTNSPPAASSSGGGGCSAAGGTLESLGGGPLLMLALLVARRRRRGSRA